MGSGPPACPQAGPGSRVPIAASPQHRFLRGGERGGGRGERRGGSCDSHPLGEPEGWEPRARPGPRAAAWPWGLARPVPRAWPWHAPSHRGPGMCPGGGRATPHPAPAGYWQGSDLLVGGLAGGVHAPMAQLPPRAGARLSSHRRGLGEEKRAALSQRGGTAGAARSRSPGERRPGRRGQLGPRAGPPRQCLVRRAPSGPGSQGQPRSLGPSRALWGLSSTPGPTHSMPDAPPV